MFGFLCNLNAFSHLLCFAAFLLQTLESCRILAIRIGGIRDWDGGPDLPLSTEGATGQGKQVEAIVGFFCGSGQIRGQEAEHKKGYLRIF